MNARCPAHAAFSFSHVFVVAMPEVRIEHRYGEVDLALPERSPSTLSQPAPLDALQGAPVPPLDMARVEWDLRANRPGWSPGGDDLPLETSRRTDRSPPAVRQFLIRR